MPRRRVPDPLSRRIGERVRQLREDAGLTLEKLAYESDLGSKGHLSDLERGLVRPTLHSLHRLAERLGVALVDIVTFPDADLRSEVINRTRGASRSALVAAAAALPERADVPAFRAIRPSPTQKFRSCVPLIELVALAKTATVHGRGRDVEWVVPRTRRPLGRGMFVAQIPGGAQAPTLADGSFALFTSSVGQPLNGKVVVVQRGASSDVVVRRFTGVARVGGNAALRVTKGELHAESPRHARVVLDSTSDYRVLAELVARLPEG